MNDNTGGPAYPTANWQKGSAIGTGYSEGMSLRDWFAGKAMQGIVTRGVVKDVPLDLYAENAYRMADAMLKAREAGNES